MRFSKLAFLMGAVVLSACAGGDDAGTTTTDSATAAAAPATSTPATGTVAAAPVTGKWHEVKMTGDGTKYQFEPADITINQGDGIKFVMVSGGPHNVAFDPAEINAAAKPQLSANMPNQMGELSGPLLSNAGEVYEMSFANVPTGKYNYFCTPHLAMNMRGTITIQ